MMTQPLGTKRKHQQQNKLKRNPLGVVEFTSALNGDDPYEILKKLHRFVRVVSYERFLALSPRDNDVKNADVKNDNCSVDDEVKEDEAGIDNTDEDVMSILSFDEDHDSKLLNPKTKRQKPDWQTDKNNYLVPFVGTSVTKGQTGSVVPHSQIWPSGFLEVYLKHSPMGVELLENDFVGALPPSGVHKILLGNEENNFESSDQRKRKKNDVFGGDCAQSRGQIVSIALQTNYWMALAEWISGFVSKEKLQREIFWDWAVFGRGYFRSRSTGDSARNNKCAISPNIMSILMKIRLPEWLDVIQKYEKMQNDIILRQQRERRQQKQKQQKLQKKHNVKEGHHQKPVEQQMPEEDTQKQLRNEILNRKWQIRRDRLLASALKNLTYLCLLSNGTAREVVRKLSARSDTGSCEVDSREKIIHHKGGTNTTDGISWMVQILEHQFSNEKLEQKFNAMLPIKNHNLQTECLRLVCTLLETRDTTILSRIAEVPTRFVKRGGAGKDSKGFRPNVGSSFGGGAVGVIYIVLRFGTQRLINIYEASVQSKIGAKVGRNSHEDEETSAMYARYMVRFLSGIRDILLPSSVCSDHDSERNSRVKNTIHIGDHDFPIAPSLMVNLLTGEILNNLAKLSRLAPTIDTNTDPVKDLIEGKSIFEGLVDPMESACTEARRLLFILLADAKSSPFLHHLQHLKNIDANKFIEQAGLFLPQLGMTLHSMMIGQGYNLPMRIFLNRCLNTTPELVPHFFKTLQLNEPKPNYRTISSLSFIEGILRAAPALNHWTYLGKTFSAGEARGTISTRWALSSIIPPCVTKLILAKVVQSPSALLVSSGLKLLATILRRTRECTLSWAITSVPGNNGACNELFQEVLHHLPDVSLLLSIPSRFDPYKSTQCDASSNANSIVMIHLCETIQCIVKLDPVSVMNIKFDWVKFLPNESTHSSAIDGTTMLGFHNVEPLLQHRILQTLLVVSKLCNISFSNKMLLSVLTLLVSTDIPDVYSIARDLAISLMEKELFRDTFFRSIDMSIDERSCHAYESSLWVDGISSLSIEYLVAWLAGCRQLKVQQKIMISQAWSKATLSDKVPPMSVSALLLSTVCHIVRGQASKSNLSDHFSMLVIDIAVEMLLYQTDPRPFAAVIVFNSHNMIPIDEHTARLIKLAKVVLSHNDPGSNGDSSLLSSGIFEKHFNRLQRLSRLENCTSIVHLRQCLSLLKVSGDQYDALSEILIKSINQLLMAENDVPDVIARLGVAVRGQDIVPSDRECVIALLLTFIGSTQFCVNHHRMTQTSILGTEQNEGILSTLGTSIIYALMQSAFVPCELSDGALSDLWKHCILFMKSENTHAPHLETFLLRVILKTTPDISTRTKRFALVEVFELWAILSEDLSNQLVSELTFCLEEILSASFAKNDDGWGTWNVYKRICDLSAQKFSKLCWNSLKKNYLLCNGSRPTFVNGKDFLSEVINYDSSKFDFLPDMLINAESNREMKPILDCGYLDPIAATYVLKAFSQKNAESIKATSGFANAAKHIGKSLLSRLLAHIERDNAFVIDLVLEAIQTLCLNKLMLLETSNKLAELMDHLENSRKNISIDREIKVFDLTSCVISPLLTSELLDASTLLTKTFLRICAVFTKCLKRMKRSRHDTLEYSTTQLMYCFSSFLQRSDYFDKSMINELSTSVDNIIVLCLKYGMMEPDNVTSSSILGGCLKMVRLMLSQSSPRNSSEHQIRLGNMSPAHVHALIVSHSSFRSALVGRCTVTKKEVDGLAGSKFCEGLAQRFELLSLMICCASLDVETTTISKKAWDALLSVYNASTSPFDTLIRRLLFLYEKRTSFPVQMNELRWGQPHVKYSSDNVSSSGTSHDWDWFVDSIDLGRVRSTLSQFPVSDTLKPSSLISNDSCGKIPVHSFHVSLDNEVDYGSDNESGDDDQTTRSNELQRVNEWPTENYAVEEWRGPGEDPRYSPGFILPLILATMETSLPMAVASKYEREKHENELSASDESYNAKNETDNIQCREFCQICRRLYNNGAISLAVASLSSQCPSLRKVALSICGLFLESLQIQKSSLLKDWRERPQLEMLMSSIQRGLSVRRSIRIKKIQGSSGGAALRDDGEATSKLNVTMLPAFSAVFLAKALLILSRPADDMYGQMNRYFLRLTQFHGAFQDFFGLPGFLSLYCSSSDDLLRCKSERNWALQLLIDGAVDEFSFRIIARHHVPELIMSSVGSQIDCPGKKSEILIAIDALRTLIECGGPSAISHIVMRQGLLSWLHGIVNWRKVSALFPFDDMKCKFLRLIVAAVKCHRSHTSTPGDGHEYCSISAFHEGVPLADVVIRIFLDSKINTDTDVNVSINGNQTELYELTCDALWEVYLTTPQKIMGKRCSECHGMTMLDDMTSVLEKFATHKQMCARVLAALCALPLASSSARDDVSAKTFCDIALGFILSKLPTPSSDLVAICLRRILELIQCYGVLASDPSFSSRFMKARTLAVKLEDGVTVWNEILKVLNK